MISCNSFGPMQTSLTRHMLLNSLYQARKVSGHVYVWYGQHLCLYLQFCNWIIELFRQCGICCFCVRFQNCSDSVELFVFPVRFQNCTDSVELFVFPVRFQNFSDSVVFVVFCVRFQKGSDICVSFYSLKLTIQK